MQALPVAEILLGLGIVYFLERKSIQQINSVGHFFDLVSTI